MPKLEIHKRQQLYKELLLPDLDVIVLGRTESNDILLLDQSCQISRFHAALVRISATGDLYFIRDLGSTQGTTVNGAPVYQRVLRDGDMIEIGKYRLFFRSGVQAGLPKMRIRISKGSSLGLGGEASTSALHVSGKHQRFNSEQRELLEQLEGEVRSGTSPCAADLVSSVLRSVHADRGFIGILSDVNPEVIEELGVTNLGEHEEIEIGDDHFLNHLREGEAVEEGNTLLVPFPNTTGPTAFLCINRRDKRSPFTAKDADFLFDVAKLTPFSPGLVTSASAYPARTAEWPVEMVGQRRIPGSGPTDQHHCRLKDECARPR